MKIARTVARVPQGAPGAARAADAERVAAAAGAPPPPPRATEGPAMNFVAPFIRRPVMTTLFMLSLLAAGFFAWRSLPVSDLPNVDFPTVTVSASLPGASPETMAASVATPLEKQFSTIAGIDNMTSSSQLGSTSITIQFSLDRNVDAAAQDVQAAISATLRTLPQGIIPPSYQKVNPADQPILFVTLSSTTVPLSVLDEIAQTQLAQQLSTVSGVAQVQVFGSQKRAVRIRMDPRRLYQLKLGTSDVAQAVASQSPNLPSGTLYGPNRAYVVQANGQLTEAAQFGALTVAYRNGAPVRLSDVAQVADSVQDDKTASWFGAPEAGEPIRRSITLAVQRQPGTNTVEVADEVKALLPKLTANLPGGVTIYPLYDRSQTIRESVHDVELTLLLTLVLVVLVVFLFLRSPRATAIPSVALPLSIAGTFAVMKVLGYSLDNLSLMALTLAVGFVVDDAIVVLENIVRHREMGKDAMTAAHEGAEEVAFTVLSMTLSLAAVFLPLLFMGGIVGRLFREFSVTIAVSILVSGVVSLTVTPMLASRFLTSGSEHGMHDEAPRLFRPCSTCSSAATPPPTASTSARSAGRWATGRWCSPARRSCSSARTGCTRRCPRASSRATTRASCARPPRRRRGRATRRCGASSRRPRRSSSRTRTWPRS
jgi:HAE1 family hydrophobic/amphiphilic exporter-1